MAVTIDTIIMYIAMSVKLVVNPSLGIFGLLTNVINLSVFIELGLSDGVNSSFFILSVWDGMFAVTASINSAAYISDFILQTLGSSSNAEKHAQLVFWVTYYAYPIFQTLSITTTIVIAVVRCCCVALPFKVKAILTTRRQLAAIFVFPAIPVSAFIYAYSSVRVIPWKNAMTNKTNFILAGANREVYSTCRNTVFVGGFVVVTVCAIILTVFLKKSSKFRETSVTDQGGSTVKSPENLRDARITKAFVMICLCVVICNMSAFIYLILYLSISDFVTLPKFKNIRDIFMILGETFSLINVIVNIFIYYFTNNRFRQLFWQRVRRSK